MQVQLDPDNRSYKASSEDLSQYLATASSSLKLNFVRKVYLLFCFQVLAFTGWVFFVHYHEYGTMIYTIWPTFIWQSLLVSFGIIIGVLCLKFVARITPLNYLIFLAFTITYGYFLGWFTYGGRFSTGLELALLIAWLAVGLTVAAWIARFDFVGITFALAVVGYVVGGGFVIKIFFPNDWFWIIIWIIAVSFYGIYLVYDTRMLIGHRRYNLQANDYIIGALAFYIDFAQVAKDLFIQSISGDFGLSMITGGG
jgi:hypothetical protein